MKNFSYRTLIAALIFGLLAGSAPFSTNAETTVVILDTPVEGETYYTDEPLTISWPENSFVGPISLFFRTEAQEGLPPSAGGISAVNLPENTASHTITVFGIKFIPVNKYKIVIACGEELCGETGYFNIENPPEPIAPVEVVGELPTNGDDDTPGTPPSTGGTNTGGQTNGDDDTSAAPEENNGNTVNGDDDVPKNEEPVEPVVAQNSSSRSTGGSTGSSKKTTPLSSPSIALPTLTSIESCTYINDYLNIKSNNNPIEVTKLQTFLLNTEGIDVEINGIFDQVTFDAVRAFQTKYLNDIMIPWGLETASGVVSYTTKKKINEIYCKSTFALTPAQLAAIENYKRSLISPDDEFVPPSSVEVGFAEPENVEVPVEVEQFAEVPVVPEPQQSQTASALDASEGFFERIANFFKNIF
ncbi:MAG: hypothetical protein QG640_13 [Patescibacteria group bacterium]|nr:hypothetical protein [Patescibacteria group bacterium]